MDINKDKLTLLHQPTRTMLDDVLKANFNIEFYDDGDNMRVKIYKTFDVEQIIQDDIDTTFYLKDYGTAICETTFSAMDV